MVLLRKFSSALKHAYNYYLRRKGAHITKDFNCPPDTVNGEYIGLYASGTAIFEKGAKVLIGMNTSGIPGRLEIGTGFYMNRYTIIDCHYSVTIGRNVQIGPSCYISDFDHDIKVNPDPTVQRTKKNYKAVAIGDNVWIGANSIILKGVTIGKNAVIGAGSVITKDVPENTIYAGNPQRLIRNIDYE